VVLVVVVAREIGKSTGGGANGDDKQFTRMDGDHKENVASEHQVVSCMIQDASVSDGGGQMLNGRCASVHLLLEEDNICVMRCLIRWELCELFERKDDDGVGRSGHVCIFLLTMTNESHKQDFAL
jgi:hypothetical protein